MSNFAQKYTIAQLLEPMNEGDEYASSDWPLHVTIVGIFAIDLGRSDLFERLARVLDRREPFTAAATHDEYFGPKKQTYVTLLDATDQVAALHYDVAALLKNAGATFDTPQFIEEGFRPHATVRPQARLQKGDTVHFNALTIIDMFPNHDPFRRKVLKTIPFGG